MAIKFSQFNLRTESTPTMHLVGYDGNQNIHITVDNLLNNSINGTENTIAMFGTGGTVLADSILSQDAGATILTVGGQLNVDAAATFDTSITVTGDTTLNGNVQLGNGSADLITQYGTLYLNGPVKDKDNAFGGADQILVSNASSELRYTDFADIAVGAAEVVEVPVKNLQGSALTKGDPVYISGDVGASGKLEVKLADASNAAKMPALGLLKQDLGINEEGFAVVTGKLRNLPTSPIDGQASLANDVIYVKANGTTGAALTLTKPTGSNLIQNMGKVGRVSTSNDGTFVVSSILRTNDIPNLTPGRLWVGSTGNTIESQTLFVDEANERLGIGETNPDYKLHIDAPSGGFLKITESGADRLTLDSNGEMVLTPPSNWGGYFKVGKNVGPYETAIELGEGRTANGLSRIDLVGDTTYTDYGFRIIRNNGGANTTSQLVHRGTGNFELVSTDNGDIILNPGTGNVGIGTTNPGAPLTVTTDGSGTVASFTGINATVQIQSSVANNAVLFMKPNVTGPQAAEFRVTTGYNFSWTSDDVTPVEKMNLNTTTGFLKLNDYGSGTITGTTAYNLSVDSSGNIIETGAAVDGSGTLNYVTKWTPDGNTLGNSRIYDNGTNVAIGDTNPPERFTLRTAADGLGNEGIFIKNTFAGSYPVVNSKSPFLSIGTSTLSSDTSAIYIGRNATATDQESKIEWSNANNGLSIYVKGQGSYREHARFGNLSSGTARTYFNGNVGIGTPSPFSKLEVSGDTSNALLTLKSYNGGTNDAFMRFYDESNGPSYSVGLDSSQSLFAIAYGTDGNSLTTGQRFVINSSGNVGIGTTSPGEKLEVSGNIKTTTVTITEGSTVTYTGGGATYETLGTNVAFARESNQGAMYNPLLNPGGWDFAGRTQAPIGLLFNTDGWSNLTNIQERNYLSFVYALGNNVGNNIVNTELIMWDYLNDNYYKLKFTAWGQGGVGGYTYQRTPLTISNKRSIATDTVSTNKITVGDKINMPSGIRLASNIDMGSPANDRWADLLVDPAQSTIKIVTDTQDIDDDKVTESENIRIGHIVGRNTGTGVKNFKWNVLIGRSVSQNPTNTNSYCLDNVFIGDGAGADLGQGSASYNVGIGNAALVNIQGGDYNTVVGSRAGIAVTSGNTNTFIGRQAGFNLATGSNNVALGYDASTSSSSVSNTITLGNSSITALRCQVTSITSLSDKRDKTNIEPSTYGLNVINKLNPVTFDWNMRDKGKVGDKDLGFIAQDLQEVDDENLKLVYEDNPEKLEASYGRLIPVMTKAIQELSAKIEMLESKIQTLENQ